MPLQPRLTPFTIMLLFFSDVALQPAFGFVHQPHPLISSSGFSTNCAKIIHPTSPSNFHRGSQKENLLQHKLLLAKDENADNAESEDLPFWHPERLVASFLRSLFFGLTLPFPQLRSLLQRKKKNKGMTIGFELRECVSFLTLYMAVGVVAFSFVFEKWSIIDSLYFTCVCFTTVGYGDLCPTTAAGKIFTCFFGMAGIAFLGTAIATICSTFVEAEVEAVKKVEDVGKKQILSLFREMPANLSKFRESSPSQQEVFLRKAEKKKERRRKIAKRLHDSRWLSIVVQSLPSLSIILLGGAAVGYLNGGDWTFLESIYYSIITASTIGFGDLAPTSPSARLFAVVYLPLAVGAAGEILSGIATALLKRRQKIAYETQYEGKLTIEHLRAMDADDSGEVDRAEYCFFMLKEMGVVSKDELDELFRQFDELDVSKSGFLDKEDLKMMAKLRGVEVLD